MNRALALSFALCAVLFTMAAAYDRGLLGGSLVSFSLAFAVLFAWSSGLFAGVHFGRRGDVA